MAANYLTVLFTLTAIGARLSISYNNWPQIDLQFAQTADRSIGDAESRQGNLAIRRAGVDSRQEKLIQDTKSATDALWKAVAEGDEAGMRTAVSKGADLGELRHITGSLGTDANGTPLHLASRLGYVAVAVALISEGASVHERDTHYQRTPLHWAAMEGQADIARLLLVEGAAIEARDYRQWTPLTWAAYADRPNVALTLVRAGADVNARDIDGCTPLHRAAWIDSLFPAMILVEHGAEQNAKNKYGETPLKIAEYHRREATAAYLRSVGGTK